MTDKSTGPAVYVGPYDKGTSHIKSNVPLCLQLAMDRSRELVSLCGGSSREKYHLVCGFAACQLLCARCLEYTTCSLKLSWENFPPQGSALCHMLLPEPYIRPELPHLSGCCKLHFGIFGETHTGTFRSSRFLYLILAHGTPSTCAQ